MPKKAGVEKWKKKRRQEHLEKKKYRYYIFCEGKIFAGKNAKIL